ncbi:SUKH-4 family immunity protein [Streptomyces beihaiensis]|uniref:SUKH-4 family immunity protein n=1 Tax=Streptomyces beihaiensis TaxID=2984495 RepID=A0ABT3TMZ8_9ACTN|nr:SUKH-4 family immunity protein [Streptomyces beihaiensis]MCX3058367.1 SUKH-4 family immunity protein [Streptomyces beihaiensis]
MNRDVPPTLEECLAAPLAQVVSWGLPASRLGEEQRWNIAEEDSLALREYGIAVFEEGGGRGGIQLVGSLQSGNDPSIRRRGVEAYSLGSYWRREIGVVADSGEVVGVPDDDTLGLSYINSSAALFVDISWRWAFVRRILIGVEDYEYLYDSLGRFQQYAQTVDSAIRDDLRFAWWNGVIEGW